MKAFTSPQRIVVVIALCAFALLWVGCPRANPGEQAPPDGGEQVPEKPPILTTCATGARCLFIDDPGIRSCAVLLKGLSSDTPEITFAASILGRSQHKVDKVGVVWIAQKHESFDPKKPVVSISYKDGADASKMKVETLDCYNANGVRIDAPKVRWEGK